MTYHHDPFRARAGHSVTANPRRADATSGNAEWKVPDRAADVVAALREADGDEAVRRARLVRAAEEEREGGPRSSVMDQVRRILD